MISPEHCAQSATRVRRLLEEVCNRGNLAVLPDVVGATALEQLRALLLLVQHIVPDARWTVEEQICEGETVVTRLSVHGTFRGTLLGLAPPGRTATVTGVVITGFEGERIVRMWSQADLLGLLQQLAVMPRLDLVQAVAVAHMAWVGKAWSWG